MNTHYTFEYMKKNSLDQDYVKLRVEHVKTWHTTNRVDTLIFDDNTTLDVDAKKYNRVDCLPIQLDVKRSYTRRCTTIKDQK